MVKKLARQIIRKKCNLALTMLFLTLAGTSSLAADSAAGRPLFDNGGRMLYGYGGPEFKISSLAGTGCLFGGGPVMFHVNSNLAAGLSINYLEGDAEGMQMLYGGLRAEYIFFPGAVLYPSLSLTAGGGAVFQTKAGESSETAGLIVLEADARLNLCILPDLALSAGLGYRLAFSPGASRIGYGLFDLSAPAIVIHLREGQFEAQDSIFYSKDSFPAFRGEDRNSRERPPFYLSGFYDSGFTWFAGRFGRTDGGGTRFVIGDRFAVGASGCILASDVRIDGKRFRTMETGLWLEYFINPGGPIIFSFGGLTGVGMYGWMMSATEVTGSAAFLCNPELFCSLLVTDFMMLSAGAGYRFVIGTDLQGYSDTDFWGPTISLQARFGGF